MRIGSSAAPASARTATGDRLPTWCAATCGGRGLATEIASGVVIRHATHTAGVPLYAWVATENPASRRVPEKTGFESVGFEEFKGVPCELLRLRAHTAPSGT